VLEVETNEYYRPCIVSPGVISGMVMVFMALRYRYLGSDVS
jgi:hypothetical protein